MTLSAEPDLPAELVVLVASPHRTFRAEVRSALARPGLVLVETTDPVTTVALAVARHPQLLVVDGGSQAAEIVTQLRQDFRTLLVPVLFVVESELPSVLLELFAAADDYACWPFEARDLNRRAEVVLRRSKASRSVSPLTGLPGNVAISQELARRLASRQEFAFLHADLDGFKSFNDRYGFERGDSLIRLLADVLIEALVAETQGACFAGHVGGDDFVAFVAPEAAEAVAQRVVSAFDERVAGAYDPGDVERGWVEVTDRRGEVVRAPICSVSVGVVYSSRRFATAAEMALAAAEVKGVAKRREGSTWAADRRKEPNNPC